MTTDYTLYWEDFKTGEKVEIGASLVTREEIVEFATKYDPQSFHVDEAKADESVFGGLIASGWHTCALVMRMMCDAYLTKAASLGSPGIDNIKWLKPVRPGDRIRGYRTTLETRASKSKPDVGLVKSLWEVLNQNDELVMTMEGYGMFRRRNSENRK